MPFTIYTTASKDEPASVLYESPEAATLYDAVIEAIAKNVDLSGANLDNLTLFGPLHNLRADHASIENMNTRGNPIAGGSFRGATLSGNFGGSHIHHCDMSIATVSGDMTLGCLERLEFYGAHISGLDMTGSHQRHLNMQAMTVNSGSSALRGMLPETNPVLHRKMISNDPEVSLSDKAHSRTIVEIPISTKYGDVSAMVDLRMGELKEQSPINTSPAVQDVIAKVIGQDIIPGKRLDVSRLAEVGVSFISTNDHLAQELKDLQSLYFQRSALKNADGIQVLTPLRNNNTLSTQLSTLTGDGYSALRFRSAYDNQHPEVRAAGLIEHIDTKQKIYIPLAALSSREQLPGWEIPKLISLLQKGGRGGFDWGNTAGSDGGFGRERLEQMVDAGLIVRTGRDVRNQLGGSWPEVALTPAGSAAAMALNLKLNAGELPWVGEPLEAPEPKAPESRPKIS